MVEGEDYIKAKKVFIEGVEEVERTCTMVLLFEDVVYPEEYTGTAFEGDYESITVVHLGNDNVCIEMDFDEFVEMWMTWRTKFNEKADKILNERASK